MTRHETHVRYDIAESGILPLSMNDLLDFEPVAERAATLDRLTALPLGYSEARGTEALRSQLAATYARGDADHILVTTGAIEANFLLFNVLLETGDHVIAPYPAYQQLYSVPRAIGCDVSLWHVGPETGYRYDLNALERLLTPRTRVIIVNTPHNPTGAMMPPADAQRVYEMAESVGATVIGDEAYRWLAVPDGEPFAPPMFDLGERGISVGTLSKPFGLPGLRIGWIAGPPDLIDACWGLRDYITLSPGQAQRRARAARHDAPRPHRRSQPPHHHGEPRRGEPVDEGSRRNGQLDAAARRPARALQVRPADALARARRQARHRLQRDARAGIGVRVRASPAARHRAAAGHLSGRPRAGGEVLRQS